MSAPSAPDPIATLKEILGVLDANGDHFAVLQVPRDATPPQVRDQYFRLAKLVHPDLPVFLARPQLKLDASRAFQAITAAHATLADPQKRAAYLTSLEPKPEPVLVEQAAVAGPSGLEPPLNEDVAKIYLHRGRQLLARRDWALAQESLDQARTKLEGRELADCKVMLGWAVFNNTRNPEADRLERPRELWNEVIKAAPNTTQCAQASYYLAVWHKLHGEMRQVLPLLEKCLALEPKHIDAAREKRLLEMRRETGTHRAVDQPSTRPSKTSKQAALNTTQQSQKVALEKKPSWLERLFGKSDK
jgi:curved DNA-binding protein CbpA